MKTETLKIIELRAENVKRIKAVTIRPDGALTVIKGRNGQGKSSTIDAIELALGGKTSQPPKVIRDGEEKAQVVLDLDSLVVTRRWTSKGSYLDVRNKDGAKFSSPQAILDGLTASLSFDPLGFTRLPAKDQAETLRKLVGLDFTALDQRRRETYDARTEVNRELTQAKSRLVAMPEVGDAPKEEMSLADLLAEQEKLAAEKAENDRIRAEAADHARRVSDLRARTDGVAATVERLRKDLADAEASLDQHRAKLVAVEAQQKMYDEGLAELVDPDQTEIRERIRNVEADNAKVRQAKSRAEAAARVKELEEKSESLSVAIGQIDAEKEQLLSDAKFPVPGLSFSAEGVSLNGIPFQQASSAEQLKVSLAIGLALNPKLKVILIRDGSLLDEDSLALVASMAHEAGAQVFLERVGTHDPMGVIIEDGEVLGALEPTSAAVAQ